MSADIRGWNEQRNTMGCLALDLRTGKLGRKNEWSKRVNEHSNGNGHEHYQKYEWGDTAPQASSEIEVETSHAIIYDASQVAEPAK